MFTGMPYKESQEDSLKWDCVRKDVCCICGNTNIDSLLYRCHHMCTCQSARITWLRTSGSVECARHRLLRWSMHILYSRILRNMGNAFWYRKISQNSTYIVPCNSLNHI